MAAFLRRLHGCPYSRGRGLIEVTNGRTTASSATLDPRSHDRGLIEGLAERIVLVRTQVSPRLISRGPIEAEQGSVFAAVAATELREYDRRMVILSLLA